MMDEQKSSQAYKTDKINPIDRRKKIDKIVKTVALILVGIVLVGIFILTQNFSSKASNDVSRKGSDVFGYYKRYANNIYVAIPSDGYYRVPNADAASFKEVDRSRVFAKDAHAVYCANNILPKLSPNDNLKTYIGYITNGTVTYFCDNAKKNPSIGWFEVIFGDHDEHSLNKVPLYYNEVVEVQGILSDRITYLIGDYVKDGVSIFYKGKKLEDANGAQAALVQYDLFEVKGRENDDYIKDGKHFYYHDIKIPTDASFTTFRPFATQWQDEYGVDSKRYYFRGVPFPDKADGYDATKLSILVADRAHANHEIFYNKESLFFYDYRQNTLKYMCQNRFSGEIKQAFSGVYYDDNALYIFVPVEIWAAKHGGLIRKETRLFKVDNFDGRALEKVEDVKKWNGGPLGSLYQKGSEYFFKPSSGQFHGHNEPIYRIENPHILKLSAKDEKEWKRYESDSLMELFAKQLCKAQSDYR